MMTNDISILGLIMGLLLFGIPLYAFYYFKVAMVRQTVIAAVRMVVQLFLIGLYLKYLFEWNNAWINLLWVIIMVLVATFTGVKRVEVKAKLLFLPLCMGMLGSAVIVGLYTLIVVLGLSHPFDARYFIPIMGILLGNMLGVNVIALKTFYEGIQREHQLYYYLLGNGATHLEAITPFIRQALDKSFAPCIANMAVMGIVSLPGTMIGQILGGSAPGIAIKYQMVIIAITVAASMLSMMIALYLADRKSFDVYGRIEKLR